MRTPTAQRRRYGWKPTDAELTLVEHYASVGLTHSQIGGLLGVSTDTVQRKCRDQLKRGLVKATARVGAVLLKKAFDGDVVCMIFWLKMRAGWSETDRIEKAKAPPRPRSARPSE